VLFRSDPGAALECDQRRRKLHAQLDDVERDSIEVPRLMLELGDALKECEGLLRRGGGAAERQELERLRGLVNRAMQGGGRRVAELERLLTQARELYVEILNSTGQLEYKIFEELSGSRGLMEPRAKAEAALAEGERAYAARDRFALGDVNRRLYAMLPPHAREAHADKAAARADGGLR
jgi:molecular chaperone DnaK